MAIIENISVEKRKDQQMGVWEGCLNEDGVCLLPPFLWVVYKLLLTSCWQCTDLGSLPVGDRHNSHIDSKYTRCMQNWTPLKRCHRVMETKADLQLPSWATCGHETPPTSNSSNILSQDEDCLILMVSSVKSGFIILFIDSWLTVFIAV